MISRFPPSAGPPARVVAFPAHPAATRHRPAERVARGAVRAGALLRGEGPWRGQERRAHGPDAQVARIDAQRAPRAGQRHVAGGDRDARGLQGEPAGRAGAPRPAEPRLIRAQDLARPGPACLVVPWYHARQPSVAEAGLARERDLTFSHAASYHHARLERTTGANGIGIARTVASVTVAQCRDAGRGSGS